MAGILSDKPELANLDIQFASQALANSYYDIVTAGLVSGDVGDLRTALDLAKSNVYGGHWGWVTVIANPPTSGAREWRERGTGSDSLVKS